MKIAFLSDIHGNAVALEAVLKDIEGKKVDQIVVLGDISYRGPEPKKALELVRSLPTNTVVLKGNADEWVVRGVKDGEVSDKALQMMNKERDWIASKLTKEEIEYLNKLPMDQIVNLTEDIDIHAFHATPTSLFDVISHEEKANVMNEKLMKNQLANLYIYGHIHFPYMRFFEGKIVVNTGSVGLPFDGHPLASYLIVEGEDEQFNVSIQRVSYDVEKVVRLYEENDYPNKEMMISIIRNGKLPNA